MPQGQPKPKTLRATLAGEADTVADLMRRMDWAALEIVLVVDAQGRLAGTVTDGDIRRAILKGLDLSTPASAVMNRKPIAVEAHTPRAEALRIMRRFGIRHLPCLDACGRPVRLEMLDGMADQTDAPSAVIMAGGLGQRLRPLTENTPKPMLKVADRPILDHILGSLRQSGIRDVVISVNYLADRIREHIGDGAGHDLNVNYVSETKRLGTAGALALLAPRPRSAFLVMNGDLLTGVNFASLFRFQKRTGHDLVVCVRRHSTTVPYGVLEIAGGRVVALKEKPTLDFFINAGIYVVEPHCLDLIEPESHCDMTDLIQKAMDRGFSVGAFPIIEYWRDIGSPEDYARANAERMNVESRVEMPAFGAATPAEVAE